MTSITLKKIFASQAKPKLFVPNAGPALIWKTGDNLFTDLSVMFIGNFLNNLWSLQSNLVKVQTYGIFPCGNDRGFIECVSDVCSVREYDFDNLRCSKSFLGSLAGACLLGWVLGIKDRHQDNQLIKTSGKKMLLIPIDFGFLFNSGPMIDAPRISFPNRLLDEMKKQKVIDKFIDITVDAYAILWDNQDKIRCLGTYLFPDLFPGYFNTKTFFELSRTEALDTFKAKLKGKCTGKSLKHTMKDIVHNYKLSKS